MKFDAFDSGNTIDNTQSTNPNASVVTFKGTTITETGSYMAPGVAGGTQTVSTVIAVSNPFATARFQNVPTGRYDLWATWKERTDGVLGQYNLTTNNQLVSAASSANFSIAPSTFTDSAGIKWQLVLSVELPAGDDVSVSLQKININQSGSVIFDALRLLPSVTKSTYAYDFRNELSLATQSNWGGKTNSNVSYSFDGIGRHAATRTILYDGRGTVTPVSDSTVQHLYDGSSRIADMNVGATAGSTSVATTYFVLPNGKTLSATTSSLNQADRSVWYGNLGAIHLAIAPFLRWL